MADPTEFPGTAAWLRGQWNNPKDIFTILLILGGDVVRVAIAQLCAGPLPHITPVAFSFGWVAYAVSAMLSAMGENSLMPNPEQDCILINARSGYKRHNYSWILSRIYRDFDYWKDASCDKVQEGKLTKLREENSKLQPDERKPRDEIRIALRVSVWQCEHASGKAKADWVYLLGFLVIAGQLALAIVPWALYGEWLVFLVTASGTFLALISGGLSQWREEKIGVRHLKEPSERKDVFLTKGNGDHDVLLILGCPDGMDLEALASPYRELKGPWWTRILSFVLAIFWVALLICVAGYEQHTWYLLGVGIIGILANVVVAAAPRKPSAFGIDLRRPNNGVYVDGKVMAVCWALEADYPRAGAALVPEMFPGKLWTREKLLWEYANRRINEFDKARKEHDKAHAEGRQTVVPTLWAMPPLIREDDPEDNSDIPTSGRYIAPPP